MKENQRITITKRLLKEGLLRLLKKKSIDKINVSELCEEAGINRATFYRHYEIPADILHDIEKDFMLDLNFFEKEPKNIKEVAKEFERICSYIYEHSDLTKTLMRCNPNGDFSGTLEIAFQKMLSSKYSAGFDDESLRLIIAALTGGGYSLLRTWILEDVKKTPKEMAELIIKFASIGGQFI